MGPEYQSSQPDAHAELSCTHRRRSGPLELRAGHEERPCSLTCSHELLDLLAF